MTVQGLSIFHQQVVKQRDVKDIINGLSKEELYWQCKQAIRNNVLSQTVGDSKTEKKHKSNYSSDFGVLSHRSTDVLARNIKLYTSEENDDNDEVNIRIKPTSSKEFQTNVVGTLDRCGLITSIRNHTYAKVRDLQESVHSKNKHMTCPEYPALPLNPDMSHSSSLAVIESLFSQWSDLLLREVVNLSVEQVLYFV